MPGSAPNPPAHSNTARTVLGSVTLLIAVLLAVPVAAAARHADPLAGMTAYAVRSLPLCRARAAWHAHAPLPIPDAGPGLAPIGAARPGVTAVARGPRCARRIILGDLPPPARA